MASIKIHRDLFNFERKRKGFTQRQIAAMAMSVATAVALAALLGYVLELPWAFAITVATIPAFPIAAAGFLPLFGMPAEEYASRLWALVKRGNVIVIDNEGIDIEGAEKGDYDRVYKKAREKRGCECNGGAEAGR